MQVLPDVAHRRLRQTARRGDSAEIATKQRDARGFDGDVRSRPHRDPDIGGGKRRSVVDAVAGHRDDPTFLPQTFDRLALVLRQNFGLDFAQCRACAPTASAVARLSPVSITTRTPASLSARTASGRRRLDRVGDRDHAGSPCRRSRRRSRSRRRGAIRPPCPSSAPTSIPAACIMARLPRATLRPSTIPVTPLPETLSKPSTLASARSAFRRSAHNRRRQWMLAAALETGREAQ